MNWRGDGLPEVGSILHYTEGFEIEAYSTIGRSTNLPRKFGAFSFSRSALPIDCEVGRYCSIGLNVRQMGSSHPVNRVTTSPFTYDQVTFPNITDYIKDKDIGRFPLAPYSKTQPFFKVGHDVWIGADVVIAQNVMIGTGAVIATGSVVTKDVPPYAVVGGVPARVIRYRFSDIFIGGLLALQWWNFPPEIVAGLSVDEPEAFIEQLGKLVREGAASACSFPTLTLDELTAASA